jgi:hypothetical protein
MEITDRNAVEEAAQRGQDRVTEPSVQSWQRSRCDAALEPVAEHEVRTDPQCRQERGEFVQSIAVVGIRHDHVATSRRLDSRAQRGAVPALGHRDDSSALAPGDVDRSIHGAVVRHHDFAVDAEPLQAAAGLADTGG